ncbi:MarR family transcriptional regulator [Paraburkholderia sp. GV068]|uniref:MarR family winged helix-turn-helix transcriptional regulator n=1 Tax=Paraburkholderia TaxID=1822464 RepID=UPI000D311582|nr:MULTISPECIES: MarR family winged helix-turn-helix transcriptional regulator [unclassified Paraburkholderia]PTQ92991.1 MarR family transcriptional regulator [Paraburkholderia sp. GV072]PUA99722.1 MarR family transcriptional regulator [Paraburkholderia sp. GV068]
MANQPRSRTTPARTLGGDLVTDLILLIFKANADFLEAGPLVARDPNISAIRWQILNTVSKAPKTAAQVGRELGLSRQGALWNVQALEDIELIELKDNPEDRRARLVALSAKGRRKLETINRIQYAWANELAEKFDNAKMTDALRVVTQLRDLVMASVGLRSSE